MQTSKELKDLDSQLKKTVISAESFKRGSSLDPSKSIANIHKTIGNLAGHTRKLVIRVGEIEKTVNNNSRKITSLKNISKTQSERISGENIGAKLPGGSGAGQLKEIVDVLDEIINILKLQNTQQKKVSDTKRKEAESARRSLAESALEKGFRGAIKVAEKVLAPVKSLLSRIIDYFVAIFLGRFVFKLIEWFANKDNQDKIRAIGRFLSDHWPKLLALYLRFGTGLGRFVGGLSKVVFFGMRKLLQIAAQLIGAKGAARFLGGRGGKLVQAGLQVATTVGTTMALSSGIESFAGIDGAESEKEESKTPGFSGGGLANFKNILGYFGGGPGYVSGQKGVDKVPAMLSDGEFVMSTGAVQKYGVDTLEAMNAAGGGTNKPKIMGGKTYAAGGGLIGDKDTKGFKRESDGLYSGGLIADRKEDLAQQEVVARLKRIEKQLQVQTALASGKGLDIKGASYGANLGKGFATTFQGRDAIVIKNGVDYDTYSTGVADSEITLGGKRYFAVKRGKDLIYVSNFAKGLAGQVDKYGAKNKSYKGTGGGVMSGLSDKDKKSLPKTKIMMGPDGPFVGYLTYKNGEPSYQRPTQRKKGMLESLADFFDPKGAKSRQETLNARSLRLTAVSDLEDYRRRGMKEENIKKMLTERLGANGYSRAVNDLKAKKTRIISEEKMKKISDSSSIATGNTNIGVSGLTNKPNVSNLGPNYKQQELKLAATANKPKLKTPAPPAKPTVTVKQSSGGNRNRRGQGSRGSSGGKPRVPNFGATCPSSNAPKNKKILGIF